MRITKLIAAATFAALAMGSHSAMAGDNVDADVTVSLVDALEITKESDVRLGAIIKPKTSSSLMNLSHDNARTLSSGDAVLQPSVYGAASFTVSGNSGMTYDVQFEGASGSANGVLMKNISATCTNGVWSGNGLNRKLTGCTSYGKDALKVAASIDISPNSAAKGLVNAGSIKVTIAYQ